MREMFWLKREEARRDWKNYVIKSFKIFDPRQILG